MSVLPHIAEQGGDCLRPNAEDGNDHEREEILSEEDIHLIRQQDSRAPVRLGPAGGSKAFALKEVSCLLTNVTMHLFEHLAGKLVAISQCRHKSTTRCSSPSQ